MSKTSKQITHRLWLIILDTILWLIIYIFRGILDTLLYISDICRNSNFFSRNWSWSIYIRRWNYCLGTNRPNHIWNRLWINCTHYYSQYVLHCCSRYCIYFRSNTTVGVTCIFSMGNILHVVFIPNSSSMDYLWRMGEQLL